MGGWRTHVRALDMRPLGLGGDSPVVCEKARLHIGPHRVVPVGWLAERADLSDTFDWLRRHLDYFHETTRGMDLLALDGHTRDEPLDEPQRRTVALLSDRPHSAAELAERLVAVTWRFPPAGPLEEAHLLLRSALTPTDLLHVTGRAVFRDGPAARALCE